jgi:dTDP-4-dehydrorhamnose reductase
MSATPTIFLLGASGFLGRNLFAHWRSQGVNVVAFSRQRAPGQITWFPLNEWKSEARKAAARGEKIAVVNSVAISDVTQCEREPRVAHEINCDFAVDAGSFCKETTAAYLHISSDGIFGGARPGEAPHYWRLKETPVPVTVYARTKIEAENGLASLGWGRSVRLSFVGPGLGTSRGLITFLAKSL